ncbi:MAG TPA: oxygenase MpaB family protein [Polyangia bacterium]|nr:oxygenase MpaB family protein [Polyangia bacterium]
MVVATTDTLSRGPARYCQLTEARRRFGDRVDRLVPYFYAVDPLADAVVKALAERPIGYGPTMIDRYFTEGPESAPKAPAALRDLYDFAHAVPPWVDWDAIERGGRLLRRAAVLGGMVLGARALVFGYASPGGNKPLVFSGRLREQAARRLNETSRFVQAVTSSGGLRPGGDGVLITLKVRLMHAKVRHMILASGRWQPEVWGAPINQHDMAATTLLFSLITIEGLRILGLHITPAEADDYMHLWRYVGHLIGVTPELLPGGEREAARLRDLIHATQAPPDDDSRDLVRALLHSGEQAGSAEQRARARRFRSFVEGMCRGLIGDTLADQLGVPRTTWSNAVRAIRTMTTGFELARRRSATLEDQMVRLGESYWMRVVREGLAGATADFALPERLSA